MRNAAGSHLVSGHPPNAPAPRSPLRGMSCGMRNAAGSLLVSSHPPIAPAPPLPSAVRVLALAALARVVVAGGGWDVVQSHERTLRQDIYRAGEGCHRAYLESIGAARGRRSLFHRVVLGLERRVFATTPHIVAISRRGAAEIAGLYGVAGERLSIVYNGVDLERFHPRNRHAERRAARAEIGVAADAWTLLFVGSGFERKGLATAVDALAVLSDRSSRLIVVGKGSIRSFRDRAVRLGVDGRITWLGPRPDIERWYAAADVVVLPSRYEPFGNVHLEAIASGVPVVASAAAGGAEAIVDGGSGAVVDPRDAGAVATALPAGCGFCPDQPRRSAAVTRPVSRPSW